MVVAFLLVPETASQVTAESTDATPGGSASHRIRRVGGPKWSWTSRQKARCRTVAATPYSGAASGGGWAQAGAKRSLSPSRRSTERNHKVDAPVPATTSAAVATVE